MAKRFIDTEIFKDVFIRSLTSEMKTLWIYLFCDCSAAGIWNVEMDVAKLRCGISDKVKTDEILKTFAEKIILLEDGTKWFIPTFIKIQYNNELKAGNPATKKVIETLLLYGLIDETESGIYRLNQSTLQAPSKPLFVNQKGTKDMDKEMDMDQEKEKEKEKREKIKKPEPEIILPWPTEPFKAMWFSWKAYKKKQHKFTFAAQETEQAALMHLSKCANGNEKTAIEIIRQSMGNGWKGLFELKNNNNGNQSSEQQSKQRIAEADAIIEQAFRKR